MIPVKQWFNITIKLTVTLLLGVVSALGIWLALGQVGDRFITLAYASPANQGLVTEIRIHLGTSDNQLQFVPDQLRFEAGKQYRLILDNPSAQKHYFTAKDFADTIWTRNVKAGGVEVKGAIHELELKPGAEAAWSFTPIKSGNYELHCSVPGHAEAGMKGVLTISS